ncbi:SIR2 family protein [Flavobacterium sp. RHBU_3]|uniref:SIR2 family protein n=1 Tax=Flavobacterium sp. RHBU_3 TaxID=3391184 RepID=UPI0039846966
MSPIKPTVDNQVEESIFINPFESKLDNFKNIIQDCNLSFLIGSGLSVPFMKTLGGIESWLTGLEDNKQITEELRKYIKACLYKSYFEVAMKKNVDIENFECNDNSSNPPDLSLTYNSYKSFFKTINQILFERRSNTVNKQVNIFTTNIDVFCEKVIEDLGLQFNDGFNGIFKKQFQLSNFKKSFYQKSLHYDNVAEIPVFNLLKIHGSVTWKLRNTVIEFAGLDLLKKVISKIEDIELLDILEMSNRKWSDFGTDLTIEEIIKESKKQNPIPLTDDFIEVYEQLQVVNPTKDKFRDTTFNKTYYEMLRLYANELEKENSVLFIMGFSMADEHIRDITFRAIKSNPTLKVFICSYTPEAKDIISNLNQDRIDLSSYYNVELLNPIEKFDLAKANELLFFPLLESIQLKKAFKK